MNNHHNSSIDLESIDEAVVDSVQECLHERRLFRYDCDTPQESAAALLEDAFCQTLDVLQPIRDNFNPRYTSQHRAVELG